MKFDFAKLEALRLLSKKILEDHATSLKHYEFDGGYGHVNNKKRSISSTGTCVLSLVSRDLWQQDKAVTKNLIKYLLSKRTSARLDPDNPFTTAWIVEAVTALRDSAGPLDKRSVSKLQRKIELLKDEIEKGRGGVSIKPYPPSGYLTQLVVRALRNSDGLTAELEEQSRSWAWAELSNQLTLVYAESKSRDAFGVVYVLILATMLTPGKEITPEQSSIQRAAVKTFFDCQLADGTWPLSRPLFHYPETGNAYCYEYEMLTQLLQEKDLTDLLLEYLPKIGLAVDAALRTGYRLAAKVQVWSSGHHPQVAEPESWSTASVYHFFYVLDRLLAEAVRRELFRHLELPEPNVALPHKEKKYFAPDMLDSFVIVHEKKISLKTFLWGKFVEPISRTAPRISKGKGLDSGTPRSAILFGPPGTSKTKLCEYIANFVGWPLLSIDPSMLLRSGMDGIQVEANAIFRILEQTEEVVVLLDEFDELVLDRDESEQPSRLLTTSMLPKLARIHTAGTLVFIIATNNISRFDLAIRRRGRFDRLVQVMPPSAGSKLKKKNWGEKKNVDIGKTFVELGISIKGDVKKQLNALTFGECQSFATELAIVSSKLKATELLREAYEGCTLLMKAGMKDKTTVETWEDRCKSEARLTS
jgi:hypothetical protein